MKLISHRRMESRTSRRPSSPGTVTTFPSRTSSRRRFASVIHSCSIRPRSALSRLSTRRSASRARDSLGSVIACSANCSTVVSHKIHSFLSHQFNISAGFGCIVPSELKMPSAAAARFAVSTFALTCTLLPQLLACEHRSFTA